MSTVIKQRKPRTTPLRVCQTLLLVGIASQRLSRVKMPSSTRPAGQIREVWTSDSGSMAKETAASRWPKIVQDMIEDIEQAMAKPITVLQIRTGLSAQKELKKLKEEIQDNDVLTYVVTR